MHKIEINDQLLQALTRQNPWWTDRRILAEDPTRAKRTVFPLLRERVFARELITAVVGLRRVGKTTLLKQLINELLLAGQIDRERICYFSFEDFGYFQTPEALTDLLEARLARFPQGKLYFFMDEIQYVNNWNSILKKYFDLYPQIKLLISGSSSLFIATEAQESLAGRLQEITIHPLSFGEYVKINRGFQLPAVDFLATDSLIDFQPSLQSNFLDYLIFGEFPYLPRLPGEEEKKEYLLNFVIGKVVEFDLPRLRKIYGPAEMKHLVEILFANTGQTIHLQNLGSDLGLAQRTLREYLSLLEKTYLFRQTYNQGAGFRQRSLRQRKIYPLSVNALAFKTLPINLGQLVEAFVFNYLIRNRAEEIFFFRQRQSTEVDFLVNAVPLLPVEVKYQAFVKPADCQNLLYYCRKEKLSRAVMITKYFLETRTLEDVHLRFIPAYFLV